MKRKSSPHSSDASHIAPPKRARLGWLDEIDPPKPQGQDQPGPSNYRPSSLSDLEEEFFARPYGYNTVNPIPTLHTTGTIGIPPVSTSRPTTLAYDSIAARRQQQQQKKRLYLCALCASHETDGLQLWNVSEDGRNHVLTVHRQCMENMPEISIATADGFVGWAVVMDSQRFRRRFNLGCSLCGDRHGAKIQCVSSGCTQAFHVTCAIAHPNVVFEPTEEDPIPYRLFCSLHNTESKEKRRRRQKRPVAKEAIRAAALTRARATNGDLIHIRVPEDGDTEDGFFDPPQRINAVYVCNVDVQNKTVDVSASPLRGANANPLDGIYTVRWDEVVIDNLLLSLIPDSDGDENAEPQSHSQSQPQSQSQSQEEVLEAGREDVPADAFPTPSASPRSVSKGVSMGVSSNPQNASNSNSNSPNQSIHSNILNFSSPSNPFLSVSLPSGLPVSGPEPMFTFMPYTPEKQKAKPAQTQVVESVGLGFSLNGNGSLSSPPSTSVVTPLTLGLSLPDSLPSSQSRSLTTPSVESRRSKCGISGSRGMSSASFNPYPKPSERQSGDKTGNGTGKERKKTNRNNGEEQAIDAIIEKAQMAQQGLDTPVVLLDSPKVVKAVSNFLFEDPFWKAHFDSILESFNNKSGNSASAVNNSNGNSITNTM